jgi:hypothetical protein
MPAFRSTRSMQYVLNAVFLSTGTQEITQVYCAKKTNKQNGLFTKFAHVNTRLCELQLLILSLLLTHSMEQSPY